MSEYIVRETGYPGTIKQEIVQELVRCKDCRYWDTSREWTGREGKHKCEIDNLIVPPDGYCYWGERREDEL